MLKRLSIVLVLLLIGGPLLAHYYGTATALVVAVALVLICIRPLWEVLQDHRKYAILVGVISFILCLVCLIQYGSAWRKYESLHPVTNPNTHPEIVVLGDQVELCAPSGEKSIRGEWRGSNAKFIPFRGPLTSDEGFIIYTEKEEAETIFVPILPGKTWGGWIIRVEEEKKGVFLRKMMSGLPEEFTICVQVQLPDDDRLCDRRIGGLIELDVEFPIPAGVGYFTTRSRHLSKPVSFFITCKSKARELARLKSIGDGWFWIFVAASLLVMKSLFLKP